MIANVSKNPWPAGQKIHHWLLHEGSEGLSYCLPAHPNAFMPFMPIEFSGYLEESSCKRPTSQCRLGFDSGMPTMRLHPLASCRRPSVERWKPLVIRSADFDFDFRTFASRTPWSMAGCGVLRLDSSPLQPGRDPKCSSVLEQQIMNLFQAIK